MGRRKMRFTHPKNWERKKYAKISSPQQPITSAQCPTTSEHQTASAHQPPLRSSPQQPTASAHQPPLRSPLQQPTTSAHQPPLRSSPQQPTASAHQPPLRSPQQPTTSAHQPPLRSPPQQPTASAEQALLQLPHQSPASAQQSLTFFGRLRQHGRANQNPTVAEALKSTQTLRVVDSVAFRHFVVF